MIANSTAEIIQLAIGAVLGTAVSINMSRFGLSITDPRTRWKAAGVIGTFLMTFLVLTDLIIN